MAVGDRVKIGDGSSWDSSVVVSVYTPRVDAGGNYIFDHFGAATIQRMGGVKGGTTGTILGPSIRIHRAQLGGDGAPTFGGTDLVHLFPIQLDYYQQVGWFPTEHMRVVGGGIGMDLADKR